MQLEKCLLLASVRPSVRPTWPGVVPSGHGPMCIITIARRRQIEAPNRIVRCARQHFTLCHHARSGSLFVRAETCGSRYRLADGDGIEHFCEAAAYE